MDYRKQYRKRQRQRRKRHRIISIVVIVMIIVCGIAIALRNQFNHRNDTTIAPSTQPVIEAPEEVIEPVAEVTLLPSPTVTPTEVPENSRGTWEEIPDDVRSVMAGKSMPAGASISYNELAYLTIPHYNFESSVTYGHMIVNISIAEEVLDIFEELYNIQYPIEKMEIIDYYDADDYTSIDYNNTSAFNYRLSTDGSGRLSNHALGLAIDINPQINPYVSSNGRGSHPNAAEFWSRDYMNWSSAVAKAAYIGPESEIYKIFMEKHTGWEWGGSWANYRDYQHFQKIR